MIRLYVSMSDGTEQYIDCRNEAILQASIALHLDMFPNSTYRIEAL